MPSLCERFLILCRTVLSSAGNDGSIRLWKATYGGVWKSLGHIHTEHGDEDGGDEMHA